MREEEYGETKLIYKSRGQRYKPRHLIPGWESFPWNQLLSSFIAPWRACEHRLLGRGAPGSFWFSGSRVGPENVHFSKKHCRCCCHGWPLDHSLQTTAASLNSFYILWAVNHIRAGNLLDTVLSLYISISYCQLVTATMPVTPHTHRVDAARIESTSISPWYKGNKRWVKWNTYGTFFVQSI